MLQPNGEGMLARFARPESSRVARLCRGRIWLPDLKSVLKINRRDLDEYEIPEPMYRLYIIYWISSGTECSLIEQAYTSRSPVYTDDYQRLLFHELSSLPF